MKKLRNFTIVLIPVIILVGIITNSVSSFLKDFFYMPKYGVGIDTAAHFGRDAEYHLIKTDVYYLTDQVNQQVVEPIVYRYYYKDDMAYVEGVTGFSVIDVKQLQVQHYEIKEDLPTEVLNIFENMEFKEVEELRYSRFIYDNITTKGDGGFGNTEFYLGYDKEDKAVEEFLNNNYALVVGEIKDSYKSHSSSEITSINFHLEEILSDKLKVEIRKVMLK